MAAPRPALRVTIAIFTAYVLVLQLLLAGLAGGAVAGTAGGVLCAVSAGLPGGDPAPDEPHASGDCGFGACVLLDVVEGPAGALPHPPDPQAAPVRRDAGGGTAGRAIGRSLPPARAPPA